MSNQQLIDELVANLNAEERQELNSALYALNVVSTEDHAPGQSFDPDALTALFGKLSPRVKQTLINAHVLSDEKRQMPFQPKMNQDDWADQLGLDASTMARFKQTLADAEVAGELGKRMGMDSDQPPQQPDLRGHLSQAFDQDAPMAVRRRFAEHALSGAGDHLSIRDALRTIMDVKEKLQ